MTGPARARARAQRVVPEPWLRTIAPIRHGSGMTAWQQVHADVLGRIQRGELAPDDELPSEPSLAAAYGVSRLTMRRALADLAHAGVIRTEHGVGSFVAPALMRHRIDDGNVSLLESMERRGHAVRQLILSVDRLEAVPPSAADRPDGAAEAAELFRFPDFPGPVCEYRYVRYVDEVPWSTSYAVVPEVLAPPSWDGSVSLFAAMADLHDLEIFREDRRFSAVPADQDDARWLEVPVGTPLLRLTGVNTDQRERPVARIVHRIRGDRAEYAVRVPR